MNSSNRISIAVVALALLVGLVPLILATNALAAGETWDKFEQCKVRCNEAYGGVDIFRPRLPGSSQGGFNNCILQCEREHWRDLDKETEDK